MDAFTWLDQFLEENSSSLDASTYFFEEGLSSEIERMVQFVINKIQELILTFKAKYAQIKFTATLKKVTVITNRQIRFTAFLPSDVKRLLKNAVDTTGEYVVKSEKIYRKFVNGDNKLVLYDKYLSDMKKNDEKFAEKMKEFTSEISDAMKQFTLKENSKVLTLLTEYDNDVSNITTEYTKVGNEITKQLSTIRKTPVTGKSPEIFRTAAQTACYSISSIWSAFTKYLNSLLDALSKAGNNIICGAMGCDADDKITSILK